MSSSNLSKATTKAQCKSTSDLASINVNSPSLESNNQHSPKIPCADQTNQSNQNAKLPPTLHKLLQPFSPSSIHEGSTGVEANSSNSLKSSHATSEECSSKGFSLKKIKSDFKNLFNHGKHSQNVKNHNNSRSPSDVIQEDWVEIDKNLSDENKPDLKKDGNYHCHTIGASTGSHLRDLIKQEEKSGILDGSGLREKPQTLKQTSLESDQIKRNCSSTGNFQALGGSQATTPTNSAQSNPNNSPQPTNYNLKAAAINLKILPSNQPSNYYIDSETHADIQKKLSYLTPIERIELQRVSYNLLKSNYEIKNSYAVSLEEDIKELNQKLLERNETIRSQFEIDNLRNEIRNLTNEKAELEIEISKRADWKCSKCTYDNKSQDVICRMCETERDEIYICKNCNTRNPIINLKCTNCSANLGAENQENRLHASASEGHYQQSSPHLNPHQYKTQSSTTSTGSSGGSATSLSNNHGYSHNQHSHHYQQQYSNQPNIGGRSRNASSTSLNNQNAVDSLGSNPNLSQPKTSHRPPPPPPPIPQYQHQSQQQQHHIPVAGSTRPIHHPQISSAPILGPPTIPFVPGYGVVAPPMTPQPPQGGRSPLIFHNNSSHSSPNFGATPR